jgi:type IV secretion system protein VirB3
MAARGPNVGVIADTLFIGVTRPAVALGVPYAALLMNALVTLELFLTTKNLLWLLVCIPMHGLSWLACLAEPRFFELLAVWGQIRARTGRGGGRAWRARSYGCLRPRSQGRRIDPALVVEHVDVRS